MIEECGEHLENSCIRLIYTILSLNLMKAELPNINKHLTCLGPSASSLQEHSRRRPGWEGVPELVIHCSMEPPGLLVRPVRITGDDKFVKAA